MVKLKHIVSVIVVLILEVVQCNKYEDYLKERKELFKEDFDSMVGSQWILNYRENKANNVLMNYKETIVEESFQNPAYLNFSKHYFSFKEDMKRSKLFKILKKMPKGAVLHVHDMALLGPDYLLQLTYQEHLYVCFGSNNVHLRFSNNIPTLTCGNKWLLMETARKSAKSVAEFDKQLRTHFTMVVDNPAEVYTDINKVWTKFEDIFVTIIPLLTYKPVWARYFEDALHAFMSDGALYVEYRSVLPPLYELDGTVYDPIVTAQVYKEVADKFVAENPEFIGSKLIYAPLKASTVDEIKVQLEFAKNIMETMPDLIAGFDQVGQEDTNEPLKNVASALVEYDIPFFFHAGETDWNGLTDENLFDAIALNATRIGHAYALMKHPSLAKRVKEKEIGIEVSVISNQVLCLVQDLRNHPLAYFLADGLPVVISSDDPGLWEAAPISEDFYIAWVGISNRRSDLRQLKQLALNSIQYSAMNDTQKKKAKQLFVNQWKYYINTIIMEETSRKEDL